MDKVTTEVLLDKRYKKKNGTYPVKIRVTFEREQRYYPTNIDLTSIDWEKVKAPKPRNEYKELALFFNKIEQN